MPPAPKAVFPSMKAAIFDAQRKIDKELKRPKPDT
jgi:hypothetical protein